MNEPYAHIGYAAGPEPKSEAEQAADTMVAEICRTTACGRLAMSEVRDLLVRLGELGWVPPVAPIAKAKS